MFLFLSSCSHSLTFVEVNLYLFQKRPWFLAVLTASFHVCPSSSRGGKVSAAGSSLSEPPFRPPPSVGQRLRLAFHAGSMGLISGARARNPEEVYLSHVVAVAGDG